MTRQDIEKDFSRIEKGIIRDPGKFEGEPTYCPYFYETALNGCADETLSEGEEGPPTTDLFTVTDEDREQFPELEDVTTVSLFYRSDGFVVSEAHKLTVEELAHKHEQDIGEAEPDFDAEAGDIVTEDHRKFYQHGKLWLELDEDEADDMNACIKEQMAKDKFFPNVFFMSDHGNAHLMSLEDKTEKRRP